MKAFLLAAVLAATLAVPLPLAFHSYAMAGDALSTGDSHGPRQPSGQTEGTVAPPPVMLAQAKPTWSQEPWSYEAQSPKGFTDPRPLDLNEQIARNDAHTRQTIEQLGEDGGCSAPVIPYGYAVDCSAFLANNAPFGGADNGQMGSQGD
jgi:hypothetical protein